VDLDEPVQGLQELLMADFLERLYKSKTQNRNVSKGCINNVCKDSYNEAIENGHTTSMTSVITGAMAVAYVEATKYASYILGDYE
jgi:molybdopterin-binding protein